MRYQPHIDGLRAFAVVPVVLFHIDHAWMPGGYVGVDVFFVISGFLITSILWRDMINQKYSLLQFYQRRVLRILPALTVLLLAVVLTSATIHLSHERETTGQSAIAAALFLSNVFFWQDSGYFSTPAETQPLLHTWSLAVEEQFYILFPPLLYFLFVRARRYVLTVILSLSALSLIACVLMSIRHQPTAFYLLPFRAWELGVGAALALIMASSKLPSATKTWPALVGLLLIVSPCVLYDSETLFPGWLALLPCAGAALVIGWGQNGVAKQFVSYAPFVWIGKISFSFYLWHWPIIVFWKLLMGPEISLSQGALLFFASMLLAWLSTRFVEMPFRSNAMRKASPGKAVLSGVSALVGIAGVALLVGREALVLRPVPPAAAALAEVANYVDSDERTRQFRKGVCMIGQSEVHFMAYDKDTCASFDPDRPNILLIGDSHAAQYWRAIQDVFPDANIIQATASGCRPLVDTSGAKRCTDLRSWFYDTWLEQHRPAGIILAARWRENELVYMQKTLKKLRPKTDRVIVIGPIAEYTSAVPQLLARAVWNGRDFESNHYRIPGKHELNNDLRAAAEANDAHYVDVLDALCPDESNACKTRMPDGSPMQFDYGHLTYPGALQLLSMMISEFSDALGRPARDPR